VGCGGFVGYQAGNGVAHTLENTGAAVLEVWAFGDRVPHEVCVYPDEGVAYVEALGGDVPLDDVEAWATLAGRGADVDAPEPEPQEGERPGDGRAPGRGAVVISAARRDSAA